MNDEKLTEKQLTALSVLTRIRLERYYVALETYFGARFVSQTLIDIITKMGGEVNEHLPQIQFTYLDETLPPLRKVRTTLSILIQRSKADANLEKIFRENLTAINDFFNRFNLNSEELSLIPPSDEEKRPLNQRLLNPYADDSKVFSKSVKEMARTAQ